MIVVLAIILILTTVTLLGQSNFNQSLLLTDTAYTVAFSGRQAQSFGLSSRRFGTSQNAGYGLNFNRATPGSYTLFADTSNTLAAPSACPLGEVGTPERKPGNCRYDTAGTVDGVVQTFTFTNNFRVSRFCAKSGATRHCSTDSTPLTSLDIVFIRPNTASTITGLRSNGSVATYSCAEVTIANTQGSATRVVRVSQLGEIAVGQSCP